MDADVCVTWNGVISDDDAVDIAIKSTKGSVISSIVNMPSAQPEKRTENHTETHACDCIERQAAIDAFLTELTKRERKNLLHTWSTVEVKYFVVDMLEKSPSAQPERTCVNCGRTMNNGGWYADGRTRCPIEEHYALPKDGYCHLWEKRNVTDDDYPERREK